MTTKTKHYSGAPSALAAWWKAQQTEDRREWMRVSAEAGEYVRSLSGRDDAIAVMEPASAMGNLAVWIPERAELRVDTDKCAEGIAPRDVDLSTATGRLAHPELTGACTHEGAHALASKWDLDQRPERRAVVAAALLLEESRAEKRMIETNPNEVTFLRAGFYGLVRGAEDPETVAQAARLAALGMARVDAGVLYADEMTPVKDMLVAILGEELYGNLRKVWLKAHDVADDDQATMERLGQEWLDLLPEDEDEDGAGIDVIVCGMPGGGESGEGEGGESTLGKVAGAISEAAEGEAAEKVGEAKAHDARVAAETESKEVKKNEKAANEVFNKAGGGHGHGHGGNEGVAGFTNPTASVRAAANQLTRAIQRAQHRERSRTIVPSAVPPGRLRGSAAVRRSAQRSQGIPVTAEPWRQIQRKHVDNPPITCGIMMDVSGSMRWAEKPVAEASWAIGHAIHRNEGNFATVAYGNAVHAVVAPGTNPKMMPVLDAGGGTEVPVQACRALDGALNLSNGTGVRMLVVISDGVYTYSQRSGFEAQLARLTKRGVKVLWVDMGHNDPVRMKGIEVVSVSRGEADLGRIIGAAMTKSLSAA